MIEPDQALLDLMANIGAQLGRVIERKQAERPAQTEEHVLETMPATGAVPGGYITETYTRLIEGIPIPRVIPH